MQHFQHRTRDLPNAANASFRTRRQRARRNFTRSRGARKGTASLTRSRQNRQVLLAIAGSAALRGPPVVDGSLATMLRCRDARWRGSRGAAQSVGGSHAQPRSAQRHCISHAKPPKSPSAPGYCGLCGSAWGPCGRWIVGHHVALPRRAVVGVARAAQVIGGSHAKPRRTRRHCTKRIFGHHLALPLALVAVPRARADSLRARRLGVKS
jgi:hypothetical protein